MTNGEGRMGSKSPRWAIEVKRWPGSLRNRSSNRPVPPVAQTYGMASRCATRAFWHQPWRQCALAGKAISDNYRGGSWVRIVYKRLHGKLSCARDVQMPNDLTFARTAQQEWLLSNWRRCVHVYGWQQRQVGSLRGTIAVRSIGTRNLSEGRKPDRTAGYRVEDARRQLESVCDRMLPALCTCSGQGGGSAERMLRRSWGCEVGEIGPALMGAEITVGSVRTTRDAMTSRPQQGR